MPELFYKDLGQMDYLAALGVQEQLVASKHRETLADILLFVEHPHVYTLGRGGDAANVLVLVSFELTRSRSADFQISLARLSSFCLFSESAICRSRS
jgi:lipoyl(octanoyl) transferase